MKIEYANFIKYLKEFFKKGHINFFFDLFLTVVKSD